MENISIFDIISISLILILGIKGVINGFIKEVFGLVGIVGGIFIASRFAKDAGLLISDNLYKLDSNASLYLVGFIAVLIAFWILSIIIGNILQAMLNMSGLSMIDKLAGFVVGSMKIFLVFSILAVTLSNIQIIKSNMDEFLSKSFMYPIFVETGHYIVKMDADKIVNDIQQKTEELNSK